MKSLPIQDLVKCKSIDEIVNSLSPEEREFHKELINECTERGEKMKENLEEVKENLGRYFQQIKVYNEQTQKINDYFIQIIRAVPYILKTAVKIQEDFLTHQAYQQKKEKEPTIQ